MKEIQDLLIKLSEILKRNDEIEWSNFLINLYKESFFYEGKNYDHSFIIKIMNLYGGMGSFNDIILEKNGKPLIKENDEFHKLKQELYEKCIEMRTKTKIISDLNKEIFNRGDNGEKRTPSL